MQSATTNGAIASLQEGLKNMLEMLRLAEAHEMPLLPEPRPATKMLMHTVTELMGIPFDPEPHRTGLVPQGCWWIPDAELLLYGSPCWRPLLLEEIETACKIVGLDGLILRTSDRIKEHAHFTFDHYRDRKWELGLQLWLSSKGDAWLIPPSGDTERSFLLSQLKLTAEASAPFNPNEELRAGLERGQAHFAKHQRGR